MAFNLSADLTSKLPEVTTHFALMTDLSRVGRVRKDASPGLLMNFDHRLDAMQQHVPLGGVMHGSPRLRS